jgi:hypothetical protein
MAFPINSMLLAETLGCTGNDKTLPDAQSVFGRLELVLYIGILCIGTG